MSETMTLPDCDLQISPGTVVRIGRFSHEQWTVGYGWYAWGGNRPVCGWYLISEYHVIKPLQRTDVDDIYLIE